MNEDDNRPASELNDEELAQRQAEDARTTFDRINRTSSKFVLEPLEGFEPFNVVRIHTIKSGTKQ